MNYLEIINQCLLELNYKRVRNFEELIKNDHEKIKKILNIINSEICIFDNWNFLLRRKTLTLPANCGEIINSIYGKIHTLSIDGKKLNFTSDFEKFLLQNADVCENYSVLNNMILLPKYKEPKTIDVIYYTNNFVKGSDNVEKSEFEAATDESLIPIPFVEPLLVYGTCMKMKANPNYAKFSYWLNMYKENLATMRSKLSTDAQDFPQIKINRY
ncbi:hypothetical protein IJG72_00985 [bacterium]|nr:hypothetical protein [bacterium]